MPKDTSAVSGKAPRDRGLKKKIGPVVAVLAVKSVSLIAVLLAIYFMAIFAAVRVVPMTMSFIMSGNGVTMDMPVETVLAFWIAPSLFLLGLLFALALYTVRVIWGLRKRLVAHTSRWAFGTDDGAEPAVKIKPEARFKRSDRSMSTRVA